MASILFLLEIVYEEIKRNFLTIEVLKKLIDYANKLSLKFGLSFFRTVDVEKLDTLLKSVDFLKIPSAECLNVQLIDKLRQYSKKLFVSFGQYCVNHANTTCIVCEKT